MNDFNWENIEDVFRINNLVGSWAFVNIFTWNLNDKVPWLSLTSTLECFLIINTMLLVTVRSSKIWVFGSNISFSFWSSLLLHQVLPFISYLCPFFCHFPPFNCVSFVHLSRLFKPLFLFYLLSLSLHVSCVSVQFPHIMHSMFTVPF